MVSHFMTQIPFGGSHSILYSNVSVQLNEIHMFSKIFFFCFSHLFDGDVHLL
jgi:hypothetical protein